MQLKPRLIQTFLTDGTIEGIRIIDCETTVNAIVVPRIKIRDLRHIAEAGRPALYFLINSDGDQAYIGEAENFSKRLKSHDQKKDWWDVSVAIISATNELSKGDIKYLEALAVERAQSGSLKVQNIVSPIRNTISRFSVHKLQNILDDAELILNSLNYDILTTQKTNNENTWHLSYKGITATGEYRGSQFILLPGSEFRSEFSEAWARDFPKMLAQRNSMLAESRSNNEGVFTLKESIAFRSVSMAAGTLMGRHTNGWKVWKNYEGITMDEIMRKNE